MTDVVDITRYMDGGHLPTEVKELKTWLVWRLVHMHGQKKPRKIPYYTNGKAREGANDQDTEALVSFERAVACVERNGYSGIGLAMFASNGVVAVDFDECVRRTTKGRVDDDVIDPDVLRLCEGTYAEISPSGRGVRAFFRGTVPRDMKNLDGPLKFEVFCNSGYVTVTGNALPDVEMWGWGLRDFDGEMLALYRVHAGVVGGTVDGVDSPDDAWFAGLSKVGLTIDKARAMLEALSPDCDYSTWLKVGQALHHEFDGETEALALWVSWSKGSEEKYPGDKVLRGKWASFGRYQGAPITAAWLLKETKVLQAAERYDALDHWRGAIAEADEQKIRETLCPEIGKDERLNPVDRETIAQAVMRRLKDVGSILPIGVVRQMVATPEKLLPTVKAMKPLTEFGNAARMIEKADNRLMYVAELDAWYRWTDVVWERIPYVEVEAIAKSTVLDLVKEAPLHKGDQGEFFAFAARSQEERMVAHMVKLAAPDVSIRANELDRHVGLLCVQNGVVDLKSGRLYESDRAYRMTRVCAAAFVPDARRTLWDRTVDEVFEGDKELAAFFQRLIGYCAIGNPKEDVLVIAYGDGSNGKSTLLGTIRRVLGGYSRTADSSTFLGDGKANSGGPREDLLRLMGSRFCYVTEPDEGGELREGMVKSMTGGDTISARGVYGKATVEIEPTWVVIMPTNHKPIIKGGDYGIWRRLLMVPFLRNFDKDGTKDAGREDRLREESEGVLAWIVEGAQAYLNQGLNPPPVVSDAREQYKEQMDMLADWLSECCEVTPDARVRAQELWKSWEEYAKSRGLLRYIPSALSLGRRLDKRFKSHKSDGVIWRLGLKLRTVQPEILADFD